MATFDLAASATVAVAPGRLWALLCDTRRYAEWVQGTDSVTRTDGPACAGSSYAEVNPIIGPWKARAHWTVVEFDAPRRQVHRSHDIPMAAAFLVIMEVTPTADGSRVTHTLRATSSWGPLGAVLFAALRSRTRRNNEHSVRNLAEIAIREDAGRGGQSKDAPGIPA
jgi:carbon monoxide dehydrogenase subunit G